MVYLPTYRVPQDIAFAWSERLVSEDFTKYVTEDKLGMDRLTFVPTPHCTHAFVDSTVKFDGINASFYRAPIVTEILRGMTANRSYDVSEFGSTYFLRTLEDGLSPFVATPVLLNWILGTPRSS